MKRVSRSCIALLAAGVILSAMSCAAKTPASSLDAIKKAGKLVIGTSADFPPYEFHSEAKGADTIVGFDIADEILGATRSVFLLDPRLYGISITKGF